MDDPTTRLADPGGVGHPDEARLGLNIDMLDADRLRLWAARFEEYGPNLTEWGSEVFVVAELRRIADGIEAEVRAVGYLRQLASIQPVPPPGAVQQDTMAHPSNVPRLHQPSTSGQAWANCRDCSTATWCARFGLCLSQTHADEHPEIQRVPPPGAVPAAPQACCEQAPDRSGRTCDKPKGHDGDHWTYGGQTLTWAVPAAQDAHEEDDHPSACHWRIDDYDGDSMHETDCGEAFQFNEPDDPLLFKFCPYCGKRAVEVRTTAALGTDESAPQALPALPDAGGRVSQKENHEDVTSRVAPSVPCVDELDLPQRSERVQSPLPSGRNDE